jgi:hypothetical protein|tara:strand:+ start:617 stop:724 length:108 start_codon:yes stop_codon:yes gene_type:complete
MKQGEIILFLGVAALFLWNKRRQKMLKREQCGDIR